MPASKATKEAVHSTLEAYDEATQPFLINAREAIERLKMSGSGDSSDLGYRFEATLNNYLITQDKHIKALIRYLLENGD